MRVTLVVGGRWHAFDLARELNAAGVLHRLVTTYPKFKTRQWGIPDQKVVSLPLSLLLGKVAYRLGGDALTIKGQPLIHRLFSHAAARHLEGSGVIHVGLFPIGSSTLQCPSKQPNQPQIHP